MERTKIITYVKSITDSLEEAFGFLDIKVNTEIAQNPGLSIKSTQDTMYVRSDSHRAIARVVIYERSIR